MLLDNECNPQCLFDYWEFDKASYQPQQYFLSKVCLQDLLRMKTLTILVMVTQYCKKICLWIWKLSGASENYTKRDIWQSEPAGVVCFRGYNTVAPGTKKELQIIFLSCFKISQSQNPLIIVAFSRPRCGIHDHAKSIHNIHNTDWNRMVMGVCVWCSAESSQSAHYTNARHAIKNHMTQYILW